MLAGTVVILLFMTGLILYRAREAFLVGNRRSFWICVALGIPMTTISSFGVWFMLENPEISFKSVANGFGPGWTCETYDYGATVCFKH